MIQNLTKIHSLKCEVITAVKIRVEVYWVVTPCSVAIGHQRFKVSYCLCLQGEDPTTKLHGVLT